MDLSRRSFLAAGLASAAVACAGGLAQGQQRPRRGTSPPLNPHPELPGEDGSRLWLRYAPVAGSGVGPGPVRFLVEGDSPALAVIRKEFADGIAGMLGTPPTSWDRTGDAGGVVMIGTPSSSPTIGGLHLEGDLRRAGDEGYLIRRMAVAGDARPASVVVAANTDVGALYGTFHLLRLIATGQPTDGDLNVLESPAMKIRMADHWDNPNGTIERGYAGRSLWFTPDWNRPDWRPGPRVAAYARAQASVGVNGACINNVNASAALLSADNLAKIALLADAMRPYGVRVYLSANFAAPFTIGGLKTADPNDPAVRRWWADKADEIYRHVPDFGGLLVKANSEGQPGPKDYNRSHAEGANCLAAGFAPHGGVVIWRAFVYDDAVDPDRLKRAYKEFMPLDGQFLPNVVLQVKNGPLDFQPREPFNPLFGSVKKTSLVAEIQPSQEYIGQGRHLVYLGTMWEEFLGSDTFANGPGSTVGRVLEGKVHPAATTGLAGVLNPGADPNWTGHHFSQANWYAMGRLSWNPQLSARAIADEWTRQTFTNAPAAVAAIVDLMMGSRETFVNYSMPMGLHHMIGGDHYAPMPENAQASRRDWTAVYYHRADANGIGFDRTRGTGDDYVDQYNKPLSDTFNGLDTCPEKYLLWFHRLPWDHQMKSGKTLWQELVDHYDAGVAGARAMQQAWAGLAGSVDARRHREVADRLAVQVHDAAAWRDHILGYFSGINKRPVPPAA